MKKWILALMFTLAITSLAPVSASAQCSICTRTAQQLGEKPAKGLNGGIIYLAFMPMAILGIIGYKWYRNNKQAD